MKTFFDQSAQEELQARVRKLQAGTPNEWGKMTAAQMLAHCRVAMQVPVGDLQLKRNALSLIGWMFKKVIVSDKPFSRNSPTAAEYRMTDEKDFQSELKQFQETFQKLAQGPAAIKCWNHPFFGKMTVEDWGCLMYKHLDHHLTQFNL
jgi:hypothetical protein